MRITNKLMNEHSIRSMSENQERLFALQEKVASSKQFQHASGNPAGAAASLSLRSTLEMSQAYSDTAQKMESWYSAADFSIRQMLSTATRARSLALEGVSDTLGEKERKALAAEMDVLLSQAVETGNTSHQGNYLYSGLQVTTPPFVPVKDAAGKVLDVTYAGDSQPMMRSLGPSQSLVQNIDGDSAFTPLFKALVQARDALEQNNPAGIQAALASLDAALDNVNQASTTNGARHRQVKLDIDRLEKTGLELKGLLSQKEDVNMAEAISNLSYQETVYRAVLEVGKRSISALNLFDMLG